MCSAASSTTSPSGVATTAAAAAGPGLPRAPPSTWTTSLTLSGVRGERGKVARHPRAPAVAHLAHAASTAGPPALLLAAVHDDGHVGIVLVVLGEPVVELVRERFRNDAVDHAADAIWRFVRSGSTICRVGLPSGEVEAAAVVGGGVGHLLLVRELGELVALRVAPDAARLVGEVDLVAVPAELPHHGDGHDARAVGQRAHGDGRGAQRPGD